MMRMSLRISYYSPMVKTVNGPRQLMGTDQQKLSVAVRLPEKFLKRFISPLLISELYGCILRQLKTSLSPTSQTCYS